jgi:hypothetical protein
MNTQVEITDGMTQDQIIRMCLSNLTSIDERLDAIGDVVSLKGNFYWLTMYRLCSEFIDVGITDLEYASIQCLFALVCYRVAGDVDDVQLNVLHDRIAVLKALCN